MISEKTVSGILITTYSQNHPFTISLYVKYKYCTTMTKFKDFTILKAKEAISISEYDFPDECKYEKKIIM